MRSSFFFEMELFTRMELLIKWELPVSPAPGYNDSRNRTFEPNIIGIALTFIRVAARFGIRVCNFPPAPQ